MQFEQFQEEDGKNIINITVEKDDSEELKKDAENFMHGEERKEDTTANKDESEKVEIKNTSTNSVANTENAIVDEKENKNKKYNYFLFSGIVLTFLLLALLVFLYAKGY